jgi:uncharacterized protein (TIGR02996 family)
VRTFTFSDATSHKFWNIELSGNGFTVTYGRVGTAGQTQTKTFASPSAAQKEHDKLVKEKLAKGYTETTPAAAGSGAALRKALEEAILDDPDERASYMAYADHLSEQGDPQGEFVQVQLALENEDLSPDERKRLRQREKALLKAHQAEWVGDWASPKPMPGPEGRGQIDFPATEPFRFERGILSDVIFPELTVEAARRFVRAPQTRLVRRLYIGGFAYEEDDEYEEGDDLDEDAAEERDPARVILPRWPYFGNLRVFQLGWTSDENYGDFCHFQCHESADNIEKLIARMPRLEELYLFAHNVEAGRIFKLRLPDLRVLQLYHTHRYPLDLLARNESLTRLTHLLCHPHALEHGDDPYIRLNHLRAIVRSPHLTSLTHLRLRLTDLGDRGCEEIVRSGLLKRLRMLDLRHGIITDKGASILAACPDLKNLELLDVKGNTLTRKGRAALRAVGIPLIDDHQHDPNDEEYSDEDRHLSEGDYE